MTVHLHARAVVAAASILLGVLAPASPVAAWLLYEHDQIGGAGMRRLQAWDRDTLQSAWQLATAGRARAARRYCPRVDQVMSRESVRSGTDWCVGLATLASLAGDHACSPDELSGYVETSEWVGPLLAESRYRASVVAPLDVLDRTERMTVWREHNLVVQDIDPLLVPRARNNGSHFVPPLDVGSTRAQPLAADLGEYLRRALAPRTPVNALTMYVHHHVLALREASSARGCTWDVAELTCTPDGAAHLWRALLEESVALHFLQDAFSSGHIVGTWGDLGQRLGSHDHYSEHGIDARTWSGRVYPAHGDAFLTPEDENAAAAAVAASLSQLARAMHAIEPGAPPAAASTAPTARAAAAQDFSSCDPTLRTPPEMAALAREPFVGDVLRLLPIPTSRAYGMPRFRSEVGAFLGLTLEGHGFGVLGSTDQLPTSDARLRVGIGAGFALEGAFSRFMDGRFFVDFLLNASMHEYAVGRRAIGFGMRVRMPFAILPGDLIYLALPAALIRSEWGYALGTAAAAGGVFGIERQIIVAENLSLQLVIGREATLVWFPHIGWSLDIPVLELRGDRLFTGAFASESVLQIGATMSWHEDERAYGIFVSFAERLRRYMPQGCQDDDCGD